MSIRIALAPMEGVTDAPMRAYLTSLGGFDWCVAEFLRVTHMAPPDHVFLRHIPEIEHGCVTPSGTPVHIQILGGEPGPMAEAGARAAKLGAPAVDINFGCPAPTVNRHDGGATLLKYPSRICTIVAAVRAAVPAHIPVSAKLRLGWDCDGTLDETAAAAEEGGASWITVHGRTRDDGYGPPARWEPIGKARAARKIPVVANGDLWSLDAFLRCREVTGCEAFMLGRSALANPELARQLAAFFRDGKSFIDTPVDDVAAWRVRFQAFGTMVGERQDFFVPRAKQWLKLASRRAPIPWFDEVKTIAKWGELDERLSRLQ